MHVRVVGKREIKESARGPILAEAEFNGSREYAQFIGQQPRSEDGAWGVIRLIWMYALGIRLNVGSVFAGRV